MTTWLIRAIGLIIFCVIIGTVLLTLDSIQTNAYGRQGLAWLAIPASGFFSIVILTTLAAILARVDDAAKDTRRIVQAMERASRPKR